MSARAPFDEIDRLRAVAYLTRQGRVAFDPLAQLDPNADPYFTPSILVARKLMAEAFATRRPNGERFRVYPSFIERPYANALAADLGDGLHLCAMDVGMATILFELACFCFSQTSFFSEVGDARSEAAPSLPEDALLGYWIADRVAATLPSAPSGIGEELIPLDLDRRLMAHFLTQLMMRFTWLHELYHGLNGHAGLAASIGADGILREMPEGEALALVETEEEVVAGLPIDRLLPLLEFDADRSALNTMIQLQMLRDEPFAVLAEWPLAMRLKLTAFAAMLMTFLFDQSAKRYARATSRTHPAPHLRLQNLVHTIASNPENVGSAQSAVSAALEELDNLQTTIAGLTFLRELRRDLLSPASELLFTQLDADLTQVRTRLIPFAFRSL